MVKTKHLDIRRDEHGQYVHATLKDIVADLTRWGFELTNRNVKAYLEGVRETATGLMARRGRGPRSGNDVSGGSS
jgi:hypothetical protein